MSCAVSLTPVRNMSAFYQYCSNLLQLCFYLPTFGLTTTMHGYSEATHMELMQPHLQLFRYLKCLIFASFLFSSSKVAQHLERAKSMVNYAILIGIDAYAVQPLRGAVRDVCEFHTQLRQLDAQMSIEVLITAPSNGQADRLSPKLPTYNNVITALESVMRAARKDDSVYVHFSGHGTQPRPPATNTQPTNTVVGGDLALVLLNNENDFGGRLLGGVRFAGMLRTLVDNGVLLTVTLDCCFAGSVYRRNDVDEQSVRFLPYTKEMHEQHFLDIADLADVYRDSAAYMRDGTMRPTWLLDPDGYVIFSACGLTETAHEIQYDGQIRGSLSYFLADALFRFNGVKKKLGVVFSHVRAKFTQHSLRQNPTLYGNRHQMLLLQRGSRSRDLGISTKADIDTETAIPVVFYRSGTIELQAGRAQGIQNNDMLSLHVFDSRPSDSVPGSIRAIVRETKSFTSILEYVEKPKDETILLGSSSVCMAVPMTRLVLQKYPILLRLSPNDAKHENEWRNELQKRHLAIYLKSQPYLPAFEAIIQQQPHEDGQQEHKYKLSTLNHPQLPSTIDVLTYEDHDLSIAQVCDTLLHITRVIMARDWSNPSPSSALANSFSIHMEHNGIHQPGQLIQAQDGDKVRLVIENKDSQTLHFHVYDFSPRWEVKNISGGICMSIMRHVTKRSTLTMGVPPELNHGGTSSCLDVIKIFVTKQWTSFESLELPELNVLAAPARTGRDTRSGGNDEESQDWATVSFPIITRHTP